MEEARTRSLEASESERAAAASVPASAPRAGGLARQGRACLEPRTPSPAARCADVGAALLASLSLVAVGRGDTAQLAWSLALIPLWIVSRSSWACTTATAARFSHLTIEEKPFLVLWALIGLTSSRCSSISLPQRVRTRPPPSPPESSPPPLLPSRAPSPAICGGASRRPSESPSSARSARRIRSGESSSSFRTCMRPRQHSTTQSPRPHRARPRLLAAAIASASRRRRSTTARLPPSSVLARRNP